MVEKGVIKFITVVDPGGRPREHTFICFLSLFCKWPWGAGARDENKIIVTKNIKCGHFSPAVQGVFFFVWTSVIYMYSGGLQHAMQRSDEVGSPEWGQSKPILGAWIFFKHAGGNPGGYSILSWVRMCGPKFRPPPYNKTREDANLLPISKPFVSWRALFKTNQCFLQCKLAGMHKYFLTTYR